MTTEVAPPDQSPSKDLQAGSQVMFSDASQEVDHGDDAGRTDVPGTSDQPRKRRPAWVNASPTHDVVLTEEYLNDTPVDSALSVLWKAGTGSHFPIAVQKRHDGTWAIHSRVGLTADRLIGARAVRRRRAGMAGRVGDESMPAPVQEATPEARASFGVAAALMLGTRSVT
jgi:hypothetical protein